jgi:EAL and modified HD-GYP domain-containing signal transduction protein
MMKFWRSGASAAPAIRKPRPAAVAPKPEPRGVVCVSRLPVLDQARRVVAYELLFRSSPTHEAATTVSDYTSARVISDGLQQIGLDTLTAGRRAFVSVSRRLLTSGLPEVLPPDRVVLQLASDIEADPEVIEVCQNLRRAGYALAVDDFTRHAATQDLLSVASYVKLDYAAFDADARASILAGRTNQSPLLIGKHIETEETFRTALAEGATYFQGFFFGQVSTEQANAISARQVVILRLLRAMQDPDISVVKLETLVKQEPALTYRVLRTVNSAGFGQHRKVDSIRHALVLLGLNTVRRWAMLWAIAGLGLDARSELMTMATVRARCCELLTERLAGPDAAGEGFLVGMFSLFEVILGRPMEEVVEHLALSDQARAALLGEETPIRHRLDCVIAYESGDWPRCFEAAQHAGIDPDLVATCFTDALRWSRQADAG